MVFESLMLLEYFGKSQSSLICSLLADLVLITQHHKNLWSIWSSLESKSGSTVSLLQLCKKHNNNTIKTIRLKVMCVTVDSIEEKG